MLVEVHTVLTGQAAHLGGFRYQQHGKAVILLAVGLTVEQEAALLTELAHPDEHLIFASPSLPETQVVAELAVG